MKSPRSPGPLGPLCARYSTNYDFLLPLEEADRGLCTSARRQDLRSVNERDRNSERFVFV